MLVVTANWAISDGSLSAPPPCGLFRRLCTDVCRTAVRAGFRHDGRYLPIERVVLVLAGDTFEGLVSDRWLGEVRPWERRREAAARRDAVFLAAWRHARRPLAAVARLARRGIAVPTAGRHGRPAPATCVNVPVRVVMLAGDRDAALERLALDLPVGRLGITVGNAWTGDAVHVVHGAASDPLGARDAGPTILESLAVDLLARFGAALGTRPGADERGRRLVRSLAAGQPLDAPLRLRRLLPTVTDQAAEALRVVDAWRRSVDRWAREARRRGCPAADGVVDAIAWWMHAVETGPGPGPAALRVIADLSTPLPLGGSGRALTVAGHPGPGAAGVDPPAVCLGPPAERPAAAAGFRILGQAAVSCVEAGSASAPAVPPAIALFEAGEGGGRRWEWLSGGDFGGPEPAVAGAVPIPAAA